MSGARTRSEIFPDSCRRGPIGPVICPTSLPCFISPPAMSFSCGRRLGTSIERRHLLHRFLPAYAERGHAAEHRRPGRWQVAAQRRRDRHVDSGCDRDRDGRDRVASLWLSECVHAAFHDAEHALQRHYFLVGADVRLWRMRNRIVHGRGDQECPAHHSLGVFSRESR